MAIMVLLTILTVVTTRWIPVWVEGREAEHVSVVDGQFSDLKRTIDQQALFGSVGASVGNPITLGKPGVPIWAPASAGTINVGAYNVGLFRNQMTIEDEAGTISQSAFGAIQYTTGNTRYIQQAFLYEFGAVSVNQSEGQLMKVGPPLFVDNASGNAQIRLTMISVSGDGSAFTGELTVGVRTQLLFVPAVTEVNYTTPRPFWLNVTSELSESWAGFLSKTFSNRLDASEYNITHDADANKVSVWVASVDKIIISYQVVQAQLDIA
jgi:hypothetical protein